MILGVLGGMAGGAYAYLTNSTLYRAEVSFYVYSDPDYVYDSSVNISNSEFTQAKNLVQSYILILKSNTILQKVSISYRKSDSVDISANATVPEEFLKYAEPTPDKIGLKAALKAGKEFPGISLKTSQNIQIK